MITGRTGVGSCFALVAIAFDPLALCCRAARGGAERSPNSIAARPSPAYIGYGVGGGYDLFARTISRHMSRHIPGNPTIMPVNMPGASSMRAGQSPGQARAAGRHRHRRGEFGAAVRHAVRGRRVEGPVQRPRDDHDRQRGELGRGADRLAHHRHQDHRRSAPEAAGRSARSRAPATPICCRCRSRTCSASTI